MLQRMPEKKIGSLNIKLRICLAGFTCLAVLALAMAVEPTTQRAASRSGVIFGAGPGLFNPAQSAEPIRLERAHAHNDYDHQRPLFEALENGFKSVEAD